MISTMKTKIFIFLLFLSILASYKVNSQNVVSIDSIIETYYNEYYQFESRKVCATMNSNVAFVNKGIMLKTQFCSISSLGLYPNHYDDTILHINIYNEDFDTILHFLKNGQLLNISAYVIINTDTIYGDSSIFVSIPIYGGINDIDNNKINVYPTIVDNILNIESQNNKLILSIIDIFGRQVFSEKLSVNKSIDCSNLKSGVYFCRIIVNGNVITRKIIKE